MAKIIGFPSTSERRDLEIEKTFKESLDLFEEPIKSEVKKALALYKDRFFSDKTLSMTFDCAFTEAQTEAIRSELERLSNDFVAAKFSMLSVILSLRFIKGYRAEGEPE